ncbi:MAG TPA: beta-N-acetylglucosaminidase domain-containing protein [Steroidobacteraceae bacterium]|nr:beta-N-acetylglucosaminidase domain-containing protein [Steroidobacteraceae bacterium]
MDLGVIEGFFGKPWSWEARGSAMDFLREWGYGFYVYAPKAEAFLRRRWPEPIPIETRQSLTLLRERCRNSGIAFGVGLTPFEVHLKYDADARTLLRSKVRQINEIGPQLLCILFDDMRGIANDLARQQSRIVADICDWSDARRFIVCPTYYSFDPHLAEVFGSPPQHYLRLLGASIDRRVEFFWTGEKVISEGYAASHLDEVQLLLGRRPVIWDNRISNDARTRADRLFLDPSIGNWQLPQERIAGFAINPMNEPYLSRIPLAGYRELLLRGKEPDRLTHLCRKLCGDSIGQLVLDVDRWQRRAATGDPAVSSQELRERCARAAPDVFAHELAEWLRGGYSFDPDCLTD